MRFIRQLGELAAWVAGALGIVLGMAIILASWLLLPAVLWALTGRLYIVAALPAALAGLLGQLGGPRLEHRPRPRALARAGLAALGVLVTYEERDGPSHNCKCMAGGRHHPHGGGWLADSAWVDATAYIGPGATVIGQAHVRGMVTGHAKVTGSAYVGSDAVVTGHAHVTERAKVGGHAVVGGRARVTHGVKGHEYVGGGLAQRLLSWPRRVIMPRDGRKI